MRVSRRLFVVAAVGLLAGCTSLRVPIDPSAPTTIRVENQATLDMNIYVIRGSERIRLGTANGLNTSVFTIPRHVIFGATPLRFLADPIGSNRLPVSDEIVVTAGDQVTLRIPPF
ncbi:MAG TPA: hypothetical protein VES88_08110 [Gemmatimonadaceae bacterium]|nr:hypothetical protein [Gemmatimonadaceae bacterium]